MPSATLLVDTRSNPKHCGFIAFIRGDRKSGTVRVSKCCDGCFKTLRMTLRVAGLAHLPIQRE